MCFQYVFDRLWKMAGWKMFVTQLSKEGSSSNGLTDGFHCWTCLSTSLTITSLSSPLFLLFFHSIDEQLPGVALAWSAKSSSLFKVLAFPFPPPASAFLRSFPKMHLSNFFLWNFVSKLCGQVNYRILNPLPTRKVNNYKNNTKGQIAIGLLQKYSG